MEIEAEEAVTVMSDGMTEPFTHGAPAFDPFISVGGVAGLKVWSIHALFSSVFFKVIDARPTRASFNRQKDVFEEEFDKRGLELLS
jgi:hypothetical protein